MRVLFVTHVNNLGGANRSLLQLILELRNLGVECEVLMPRTRIRPKYALKSELDKYEIPYYEEYFFWYRVNNINGFIRYCSNIIWYFKILKILKSQKYDIIHSNSSFTDLGVWISIWKRNPHIWHLREYGNWGGVKPVFGKGYDRFLTNNTAVGIAISIKQSEYYKPLFSKNKIKVIYNGVAIFNKLPLQEETGVFNFCMVGNLCEGKNQQMAIEAFGNLLNNIEMREKCHLTLVGGGREYEDILKEKINYFGISNNVTFTGEVDNVHGILCKMNCGLMLTKNEAFGRSTVEYMLHSLPVIATDSGANPELIRDGLNGYIIKQNDVHSLTNKMAFLVHNNNVAKSMGNIGREIALRNFTSKQNAIRIKDLYDEVLMTIPNSKV